MRARRRRTQQKVPRTLTWKILMSAGVGSYKLWGCKSRKYVVVFGDFVFSCYADVRDACCVRRPDFRLMCEAGSVAFYLRSVNLVRLLFASSFKADELMSAFRDSEGVRIGYVCTFATVINASVGKMAPGVGMQPGEFASIPSCIGGATQLAVYDVASTVWLQTDERSGSGACKV